MPTNDILRPSVWRMRLLKIWKGNRKPSRWFTRILLLLILYYAVKLLWQSSLFTARWPQPVKSFSLVLLAVTLLAVILIFITIWRLFSSLGGKGVIILLVVGYALAVGVKLLAIPPGYPILSALPTQMTNVAKQGVTAITRSFTGVPESVNEFRFAYAGHRTLMDLPGIDEPDEALTGHIIKPNYIISLETLAPTSPPAFKQDALTPTIPTPVAPESQDISPPIQREINIGGYVIIANTEGDRLRAHVTPGVDTEITARFPEGSRVLVLDGPVPVGDFNWWLVEGEQGKGWCAESFLEPAIDDN